MRTRHRPQDRPRADVQSRRAPALITPVMMPDAPHTSAPMVMQGRALALRTPVKMPQAPVLRNTCHGPRTSIHSALGAFHPTPIASSRTPDQPTTLRRRRRRAGIRRRARCRSRRRTKTTPERSTPPSERGTTTSTHTPTETSRDRGTPPPPPAPPSHPRRRRDVVTTRRKTTRSAPERSTPPAGVQGNYVNPHTDDDEPRPRDAHADPCPAATAPPFPPPRRPRRAAREARFPVGSARPLHRRAAAKMSPRIRTGPEAVLAAHAPPPSAAAATARRKPDQVPITGTEFFNWVQDREAQIR